MPHVLAWISSAHLAPVPHVPAAMLTIARGWERGLAGSAGRSCYATATCVWLFPTSNPPSAPAKPPLHAPLPLFPGKHNQRMKSSLKSSMTIGQLSKAGSIPLPTQHQSRIKPQAIQPSAAQLQPSSPGNLQQAGQGNPIQQPLTERIAQVEDRPLSLPACLARWLLEEEERGGGGQRAEITPLGGMSQPTLITWNSSQHRPGRRKYGQQMEMLKALK